MAHLASALIVQAAYIAVAQSTAGATQTRDLKLGWLLENRGCVRPALSGCVRVSRADASSARTDETRSSSTRDGCSSRSCTRSPLATRRSTTCSSSARASSSRSSLYRYALFPSFSRRTHTHTLRDNARVSKQPPIPARLRARLFSLEKDGVAVRAALSLARATTTSCVAYLLLRRTLARFVFVHVAPSFIR